MKNEITSILPPCVASIITDYAEPLSSKSPVLVKYMKKMKGSITRSMFKGYTKQQIKQHKLKIIVYSDYRFNRLNIYTTLYMGGNEYYTRRYEVGVNGDLNFNIYTGVDATYSNIYDKNIRPFSKRLKETNFNMPFRMWLDDVVN